METIEATAPAMRKRSFWTKPATITGYILAGMFVIAIAFAPPAPKDSDPRSPQEVAARNMGSHACQRALKLIAKYGEPTFPSLAFNSYVDTAKARAEFENGWVLKVERRASMQNGFGAYVNGVAACKYNFRTGQVADIGFGDRAVEMMNYMQEPPERQAKRSATKPTKTVNAEQEAAGRAVINIPGVSRW